MAAAQKGYQRALTIDRKTLGPEHRETATVINDIALCLALWGWSAQGGGAAAGDQPEALKQEAFTASQRALQSAAANAMARSAALTAAKIASAGPQAQAYEAALLERDDLDRQFATAASNTGQYGIEKRQRLAEAHDEIISRIDRLAADLKLKAPLYWDYRSPEPLSLAALQVKTGADAALLHTMKR